MKTKLFFIMLLFPLLSMGQQAEKLVDSTKLWSHLYMTPSSGGPPPQTMITDYIKFSSDTILGFSHYKKVFLASDSNHLSWTCIGFIREDSTTKVYYRGLSDSNERLYYDFNVQVGDTVLIENNFYHKFVVNSIDSVFIYDKFHKRIIFQEPEIWIEGIGSKCGVLQSGKSIIVGTQDFLLCYYEQEILKYFDPYYSNCYYNNVGMPEPEKSKTTINLFPNPVIGTSLLSIESNQDKSHFILEIYSIVGTRIRIINMNNDGKILINKNDFSSGLYLYRLINQDSRTITGKFEIE